VNAVIDLDFLQLIRRHSCRIAAIGILPHAVGSSSERLDPPYDEGANKLDATQLLLGRGSELLDFLHERLSNLHLFVRQLVCPRHPRTEIGDGSKLLEPEILTGGRFILGVEPFCPLAGVVFRLLKVEIGNIRAHLAAEATGLVMQGASDDENSAPQHPMGFDPQEALVERNEARKMQNCIGIQVMELNPVSIEKVAKERVRGK
jgi:hypothetical protein